MSTKRNKSTQSAAGAQKSTKDVAADQAKDVAGQAKAEAADVAGTAKEQGQALLSETSSHARGLLTQARTELSEQAGTQQGRLGEVLRTLATELQEMSGASANSGGMAAGLVGDAASRVDGAARWLDDRQPAEVLDEVRRFARRKPGTFLAAAAAVGFLGGRLTRGLTATDDEPEYRTQRFAEGDQAAYVSSYDPQAYAERSYVETTPVTPVDTRTQPVGAADEPFDQYADTTRNAQITEVSEPGVVTGETDVTFVDDRNTGRR